jgi:hypothetical protein
MDKVVFPEICTEWSGVCFCVHLKDYFACRSALMKVAIVAYGTGHGNVQDHRLEHSAQVQGMHRTVQQAFKHCNAVLEPEDIIGI